MASYRSVPVGRRISLERERREMTTANLAEATGLPAVDVAALESGDQEIRNTRDLIRIARALDIPLAELTGELPAFRKDQDAHDVAITIREVILDRPFLSLVDSSTAATGITHVEHFSDRLEETWASAHRSDYKAVTQRLPALLRDTDEHARRAGTGRRSYAQLSDVYQVTAAVMSAVGESDLGWVSADRAVFAAERAHDPMRVAASLFRLGHVFLRSGHYEDAVRVATSGEGVFPPDLERNIEWSALAGALILVRAIGHAHLGSRNDAERDLERARNLATSVRENHNIFHTEFGPTNVRLHEVGAYVELGMARKALDIADTIYEIPLSVERRSRFLVDVARAAYALRNYQRMGDSLSEAYALAPEGVSYNWLVREMLRNLERLKVRVPEHLQGVIDAISRE